MGSDAQLVVEIKAAMKRGRGAYGSPRLHRELRAHGVRVGKKRIERLMRENALVARRSDGKHLQRHFEIT